MRHLTEYIHPETLHRYGFLQGPDAITFVNVATPTPHHYSVYLGYVEAINTHLVIAEPRDKERSGFYFFTVQMSYEERRTRPDEFNSLLEKGLCQKNRVAAQDLITVLSKVVDRRK